MGKLQIAQGDEIAAGAVVKAEEISLLVDGELEVEHIDDKAKECHLVRDCVPGVCLEFEKDVT